MAKSVTLREMDEFPQRIVYVDDEPQARKAIKEFIGPKGANSLVTCATGHELIARMGELQPDLILLDLRMPEMSGPDTIDAMRKIPQTHHAPIIFVTERTKVKMIEDYKALGVIGVIYKPFDKTLRQQIGVLWSGNKRDFG